jgi:hypothetical protein
MATRKSKPSNEPMLSERPAVAAPPPVKLSGPPKFLEYQPPGSEDFWQAEKFDLLAAEFDLKAEPSLPDALAAFRMTMAGFHAFAETDTQRWFMVCRLFGVAPLIPAEDASPDDLRCLTREELCATISLSPSELQEELAHLRAAWVLQVVSEQSIRRTPAQEVEVRRTELRTELQLGDSLLARFDFDKSLFEGVEVFEYDEIKKEKVYKLRDREKSRKEMEWFIGKLTRPEWQKMLEEPMAGSLARTALVNELYLHRFDAEMMTLMPNTPKWESMSKSRQKTEEQYQKQIQNLKESFPELGIADRSTARAIVSDMALAHRQYYGHGDRKLWDGVHTAAELVFMTRTSAQLPVPRYRLGWQAMCVEARHGSLDPNFRSMLKKSDLKKLDRGFQRGVEEARLELGEKQVDLEHGVIPGEANCDEFPDYMASDKNAETKT